MRAVILYKDGARAVYENVKSYNSWRPPDTLTLYFNTDNTNTNRFPREIKINKIRLGGL
jgi:hypothetical protein